MINKFALNIKSRIIVAINNRVYKGLPDDTISPRKTRLRWIALFFCCMTTIGGYYCYDAPVPLQTPIMKLFDISATRFNLLFTVAALPNIITPIIGGVIIDRLGVRIGLFLFAFLICLGQCITTFGANHLSFNTMLIGTAIMGVGTDALCAAKSTMVVKWFHGQELAFALGLTLTISRLGSSLSSYLSPWLYAHFSGLTVALGFGVILAAFSLVDSGLICFLDKYADEQEELVSHGFPEEKKKFRLADIKNFKMIYFLLVGNCMIAYGVIKGFLNNASDLMDERFGFDPQSSGKYLTIVFILATIFSPVFGKIVDHFGKRVTLIFVSFLILVISNLFIGFLPDTEPGNPNYNILIALVGIGTAFASYAAVVWPSISLVVDENANGTAFGFALAAQNLMLSIVPLILGLIHDKTSQISHGYYFTEVFLVGLVIFGLVITGWIKYEDGKNDKILQRPAVENQHKPYLDLSEINVDTERGEEGYEI